LQAQNAFNRLKGRITTKQIFGSAL